MLKYKIIILFLSSFCGIISFLPFILKYHIPTHNSYNTNIDNNETVSSSSSSYPTSFPSIQIKNNEIFQININLIDNINFSMITSSILLLFESLLDWNTLFVSYDYTLPRWFIILYC